MAPDIELLHSLAKLLAALARLINNAPIIGVLLVFSPAINGILGRSISGTLLGGAMGFCGSIALGAQAYGLGVSLWLSGFAVGWLIVSKKQMLGAVDAAARSVAEAIERQLVNSAKEQTQSHAKPLTPSTIENQVYRYEKLEFSPTRVLDDGRVCIEINGVNRFFQSMAEAKDWKERTIRFNPGPYDPAKDPDFKG